MTLPTSLFWYPATKVAKVLDVETSSWYEVAPETVLQLAVIWLQVAADPA